VGFVREVIPVLSVERVDLGLDEIFLYIIYESLVVEGAVSKLGQAVTYVGGAPFRQLLFHIVVVDIEQLWDPLLHRGVPVILDGVVGAPIEDLGDLGPLVADSAMVEVEKELLLNAPADLLNLGVEVVVPSLTALLPYSSRQLFGYLGPLLGAMGLNQFKDETVFLFGPRSLDKAWVQNLLPPVQALDVCPTRKGFSDFLPVSSAVPINCISEDVVLLLSPMALHQAIFTLSFLVFSGTTLIQMRL
jgi:hypothetical protein